MFYNSLNLEVITGVQTGRQVLLPKIDHSPADATLLFSINLFDLSVK